MKKIIIIGGAPATGKTTLAKELSERYNCPWISSDLIRDWMKSLVRKEDFPDLFNFTDVSVEEHYGEKYDVMKSIALENKRDSEVFKGVKEFVKNNNNWDLYIIEGISVHPENISELESLGYEVSSVFLLDSDEDRMRKILYSRGLRDKAGNYADWIKEKELVYLVKTNDYYLKEVKKYNLSYFDIGEDRNKIIETIIKNFDNFVNTK